MRDADDLFHLALCLPAAAICLIAMYAMFNPPVTKPKPKPVPKPPIKKTIAEKSGEVIGDTSRKFFRGVVNGIKEEGK